MVVVDECKAKIEALSLYSSRLSHIFESPVLLIVQQQNVSAPIYRQVSSTVIVVVSCCATDPMNIGIKSDATGHIRETPIPKVPVQGLPATVSIIRQIDIN